MKTTKRILVLLCLMVVTVGAWADPTMKLTVKDGNTVIVNAGDMTLTSENHWSFSYVIPEAQNNRLLSFTSTYNDGEFNSGTCYLQAPKGTTVTFYAKYANSHALVSCDAMDHCFCDSGWCLLGTIKSSIGNVSSSVLFNYYKETSEDCQQLANTSNTSGTYYLTRGAGNKKMSGCVIKLGETLYYGDKPRITAPTGILKATLTYAECQIELEKITTFPLTIGEAGAATLCLPYEVTLPAELTAYTLTYDGSTTLIATKDADNVIPAYTPVLVNGPADTYDIALEGTATYTTETNDGKNFLKDVEPDNAVNVLHGVLAPHCVRTAGVNYVLQNNGGNVGFYQVQGNTYVINPFRAFINLASAPTEARSLSIVFDDGETTGIADVRGQKEDVRGDIFNLSGQRVGKDYKGVVIKNGRKMIQK